MENGLIHIYQGTGKGKTTAAVGLAARALGAGLRVGIACFLKDGSSSEMTLLGAQERCYLFPCPPQIPFTFCMTAEEKTQFAAYYQNLLCALSTQAASFDLLILDEVLDAVQGGLADEKALLALLKQAPRPELVLTGRGASNDVLACADYITTMNADRHPFEHGVAARRGFEY